MTSTIYGRKQEPYSCTPKANTVQHNVWHLNFGVPNRTVFSKVHETQRLSRSSSCYRRHSPKLPPPPRLHLAIMASRKQRSGSKRGPSNVEETRSPNNRQRLKEVPALKLQYSLTRSKVSRSNLLFSELKSDHNQ